MIKPHLRVGMDVSKGFSLKTFSDDELYTIHLATLEVLEQTGIEVLHDEALDIFDGGGCIVDKKKNLVKIPPYVVEDAIRSAPSRVLLAGRSPKDDVVLEDKKVHFMSFGTGVMVIDPFTGEYRESTKQDIANAALVCDALSEVDVVEKMITARDVPPEVNSFHQMESLLPNTTKHVWGASVTSVEEARIVIEMAAAVVGGKERLRERPLINWNVCPVSPLTLGKDCCEQIIELVRAGLPCSIIPMPMAGATAPVTLAGLLVIHNAETLSAIVLAQLIRKGAPVIYASSSTCLDLKTATAAVGSPELAVISAAVVKLAQYYRLCSLVAGG